jgi:DNA-binding winged helix-turn-helix (wHTH) protein
LRYLFEDHLLDIERHELRKGDAVLPVEPQVFDLLAFLIQHRERVVSRDELLAGVWNGRSVSDSTFTSRINAARNALGDSGEEQRFIRTVPRRGYRFVGIVREEAGVAAVPMVATGPVSPTTSVQRDDDLVPARGAPEGLTRISDGPTAARLTLSGLRNPLPAATWGAHYVGLWAGLYQSLTNRGVARLVAGEFAIDDDQLRFAYTDGFFDCRGPAIATHSHLHAICDVAQLDNHLIFFAFNAAQDMQGVAVIDGLASTVGPDHTPSSAPVLLFRIDDGSDGAATDLQQLTPRVAQANDQIESEARQTNNPIVALQHIASPDILRSLWPVVGTARPDGETDHILRVPRKRSLATGKRAMANLPAGAPLKMIPANLRRVLGLDAVGKIRLVHSSGS